MTTEDEFRDRLRANMAEPWPRKADDAWRQPLPPPREGRSPLLIVATGLVIAAATVMTAGLVWSAVTHLVDHEFWRMLGAYGLE